MAQEKDPIVPDESASVNPRSDREWPGKILDHHRGLEQHRPEPFHTQAEVPALVSKIEAGVEAPALPERRAPVGDITAEVVNSISILEGVLVEEVALGANDGTTHANGVRP